MKIVFDICEECGQEFLRKGNNHKYCSKTCVYKSRKSYTKKWINSNPAWMMHKQAKYRAKIKNLAFDIEVEDIKLPERCPVLGIKLFRNPEGKPGFFPNSFSLDRINPVKGYTKDNIRVISNRANLLKSNATVNELELVLKDLKDHACVWS